MISFPDIASYQATIDWDVVSAHAEAVIVKVTQGNSSRNALAADQIAHAKAHGLLTMVYHYAMPNGPDWAADARAEAERAIDSAWGCPIFVDVERNEALTPAEVLHWRDWCDEFRDACAGLVGFYSGKYFAESLHLSPEWSRLLLWQASYPAVFDPAHSYPWPKASPPWPRVDIHQHGGDWNKATFPGVTGFCDVNAFAGNISELRELVVTASHL